MDIIIPKKDISETQNVVWDVHNAINKYRSETNLEGQKLDFSPESEPLCLDRFQLEMTLIMQHF